MYVRKNQVTAFPSFAACAAWSHSSASTGSDVAVSVLRLRFRAKYRSGAPTWSRRFCAVSYGGSGCVVNLVSHKGGGGCCGVQSASFCLRVWTAWIMQNWKRPTSARSLCLSVLGMTSMRDRGISNLAHNKSSLLVAVVRHWQAWWVQSVQLLRHRSQNSPQAGQYASLDCTDAP